jgi:3-deoxy-D-manno-octulosonate 8-phosphate phosphatase (KDO 8-P phosphatase)
MMHIAAKFEKLGAVFSSPPAEIQNKLMNIKAFIFDWDGVFNNGVKDHEMASPFSEIDSMGTNLLRFSYWLINNNLPYIAVITGEKNPAAMRLVQREHFHCLYFRIKNKIEAFHHFCRDHTIDPKECAFIFDDVLDLQTASEAGLRFLVTRHATPLFNDYVIQKKLCDYISAAEGSAFAVREICELIMGLLGNFEESIEKRMKYEKSYTEYLQHRQSIVSNYYTAEQGNIIEVQNPDISQ